MPDYLAHINKSYPFPCLPHMEGAVEAGLLISFLCLNVGIYEKCSKLGIENWEFLPNFHSLISRELGF